MKILFDQGTPAPLRTHLPGHTVDTCYELGWADIRNSELLKAAEESDYELFVTTDQNLKHQHNLRGRKLGVLVLLSTSWPQIRERVREIARVIDMMQTGDYREVDVR